jgi:hypothetical protein
MMALAVLHLLTGAPSSSRVGRAEMTMYPVGEKSLGNFAYGFTHFGSALHCLHVHCGRSMRYLNAEVVVLVDPFFLIRNHWPLRRIAPKLGGEDFNRRRL